MAADTVKNFSKILLKWYHRNKRDLPWRQTSDPYHIWVSEIMLQQTTVATVIPRFSRWIKVFPSMKKLATASLQKVLKEWEGLGYYNRAKNLHRAAQMMCAEHGSSIPQDPNILRKFPGFGPYTVGAVLSIAYNKRLPIIDANVRRVIMRILALSGKADTSQDKMIYHYLEQVMPRRSMGNFNQALMELGALICDQRKPLCLQCPVRNLCKAYQQDMQETIPQIVKKNIQHVHAVIGVMEHQGKYFIQQRSSKGLLGDLWEFPGGKIKKNESPCQALKREIKEELGININHIKHLMKTHHFYTEYKVFLDVWKCRPSEQLKEDERHRWVTLKDFIKFPFPSGSVKIIERLQKEKQ